MLLKDDNGDLFLNLLSDLRLLWVNYTNKPIQTRFGGKSWGNSCLYLRISTVELQLVSPAWKPVCKILQKHNLWQHLSALLLPQVLCLSCRYANIQHCLPVPDMKQSKFSFMKANAPIWYFTLDISVSIRVALLCAKFFFLRKWSHP